MSVPEASHDTLQARYSRELLEHLDDPLVVLDAQGRIAYANRHAQLRASRFSKAPLVGKLYSHVLLFGPDAHVWAGDEELGSSTLPGLHRSERVYGQSVLVERGDERRLRLRLDYIPVHSELGSVSGTGVVFHDETEEEARRAEAEWLRGELLDSRRSVERELKTTKLLLEAAETLSLWTRLGDIAQGLADILIRATSHSRARVAQLSPGTGDLVVIGAAGAEPTFSVGERWHLDDLSGATREAVMGRRPWIYDQLELSEEERRAATAPYGVMRALLAPLIRRNDVVGLVVLDDPGEMGSFSPREIELVQAIAAQAAIAIENARLYEIEHGIAETLQETLVVLPKQVPGVEFARAYQSATYQPGWVGGDFVDLFQIDQHAVGVVIGDVSGKGTEAAVTTSLVRNTLRAYALDGFSPGEICEKTNNVIHRFTDTEAFVTLFFGILGTDSRSLRYSAAGHPPAVILAENGTVRELPVSGDAMIGAFEQIACSEQQITLRPGDRLLLYTDGVIEARLSGNHELYGESRLFAAVRAHADKPTAQLPQALMDDVIAFSDGVLRDDAAILTVQLAD